MYQYTFWENCQADIEKFIREGYTVIVFVPKDKSANYCIQINNAKSEAK